MAKRPPDPFGLSLLDVLSNALGATIVLMMIVAVNISSDAEQQHQDAQTDESQGEMITLQLKPTADNERSKLMVLQIRLIGGNPRNCRLEAISSRPIPEISIQQGKYDPSQWLVFKRGRFYFTWQVILKGHQYQDLPDTVYVLPTMDDRPLDPETIRLRKRLGYTQYRLFSVTEEAPKPITPEGFPK